MILHVVLELRNQISCLPFALAREDRKEYGRKNSNQLAVKIFAFKIRSTERLYGVLESILSRRDMLGIGTGVSFAVKIA